MKKLSELNTNNFLFHVLDTNNVVNRALPFLHEGTLAIKLTLSLILRKIYLTKIFHKKRKMFFYCFQKLRLKKIKGTVLWYLFHNHSLETIFSWSLLWKILLFFQYFILIIYMYFPAVETSVEKPQLKNNLSL